MKQGTHKSKSNLEHKKDASKQKPLQLEQLPKEQTSMQTKEYVQEESAGESQEAIKERTMRLERSGYNVACDMGSCKNIADFSLRFVRLNTNSSMHFCAECLTELYLELGRVVIPKSPKNLFNNKNNNGN